MKSWTKYVSTTAFAVTILVAGIPLTAFSQDEADAVVEEVLVTGSRIKRDSTFDYLAPVEVVSRDDISKMGVPTIADMVKNLTINTGSNFNNDFSTQRQTVGTAQVNLRGIGLSSTLVLVNGRRTTVTSTSNDQGDTFVDINQFPLLMIDRIEVLKDGAAAIYGSDAVAGVFNMITRSDWEGFEIESSYQTTTEGSQDDFTVSLAFGAGNEDYHVNAYYTYFDRGDLNGIERDFFPAFPASSTNTSGFGHVPTLIFSRGSPTTGPYAGTGITGFALDPDCGVQNSIPAPFAGGIAGFCRTDFSPSFGLVADEERHTGFTEATAKLSDKVTAFGEASFARNRATDFQASPPPVINEAILVLDSHPANPHGVDLVYFGRVAETTRDPRPATNDSLRLVGGLEFEFNDTWSGEAAYSYSQHDFSISNADTLLDRLTFPSGDADIPRAIRNDFNPFGTRFTVGPLNTAAVLEDIIGTVRTDAESSLVTADISVSGKAFDLPAGSVGVAFGGQFREDSLAIDLDANINRNLLGFEGGSADTPEVERDVSALFVEASLPISENLELQLAVRYEDYEGAVGDTTDPKVAILWQATDTVSVRGSFGTSFRAPSLYQTNVGGQTIRPVAFDPFNNNPSSNCDVSAAGIIFPSSVAVGNPDMQPEDAESFNAGAVFRPTDALNVSVDYWSFDIEDIIIKDSLQQTLNNDCLDDGIANDPRVHRGPGGVIRSVDVAFGNAASLQTSGVDFAVDYDLGSIGSSEFDIGLRGTVISEYEFQQVAGGPTVDGKGSRNFTNPFTSAPEWRVNANLDWTKGDHSAGAIVRYISSYDDDNGGGASIDSYTTLDLQYNYFTGRLFENSKGTTISLGILNAFDEDPPFAVGVQGFDSKVHDPRGRMIYIRARQSF
jgi:iron complex outermembrane recepter protein